MAKNAEIELLLSSMGLSDRDIGAFIRATRAQAKAYEEDGDIKRARAAWNFVRIMEKYRSSRRTMNDPKPQTRRNYRV